MSLDNSAANEKIRSWKGFQEALRSEEKDQFKKMMSIVYNYAPSIQVIPDYEQDLALLLSLVFEQHKTIERLKYETELLKKKAGLA